jgi:hypothetical protein
VVRNHHKSSAEPEPADGLVNPFPQGVHFPIDLDPECLKNARQRFCLKPASGDGPNDARELRGAEKRFRLSLTFDRPCDPSRVTLFAVLMKYPGEGLRLIRVNHVGSA